MKGAVRGKEIEKGSSGWGGGADAPVLLVMLAVAELPVCLTDGGGEDLNSPSQSAPSLTLSSTAGFRPLSEDRLLHRRGRSSVLQVCN